jgi:hypothetical protein
MEEERKSNEIEKMVMEEAMANPGVFVLSASPTKRCSIVSSFIQRPFTRYRHYMGSNDRTISQL